MTFASCFAFDAPYGRLAIRLEDTWKQVCMLTRNTMQKPSGFFAYCGLTEAYRKISPIFGIFS
jgi:hypothetical protein